MAMCAPPRQGLWEAFQAKRSAAVRDEVILAYLPLVRAVARRMAGFLPGSVLSEDLESYGTIGLIEAVDRFDPALGIRFETYAWPRIRGAILDHLRSLDFASRTDRQRVRRIQEAYERESSRAGRAASDDEVARAMGIPVEELQGENGRLRNLIVQSFEDLLRRTDAGLAAFEPRAEAHDDPAEAVERGELIDAVRKGLTELTDREKLVVGLYYYERLTLGEIAAILGLTESRVCQVQASALLRLRAAIMRHGITGA